MIIHIIKESSIDYPGEIGPVIFTFGCNFNCGFCHNAVLNKNLDKNPFFDENKIIKEIEEKIKNKWYTGICITGGEPLIHGGNLERFLRKLKALKVKIKLDTNGSNPEFLKKLVKEKLIDYIAMDIKGPKELYEEIAGAKIFIEDIEESVKFLASLGKENFELRTTIPLIIENKKIRFMNEKEAEKMAIWVFSIIKGRKFNWYLQPFFARTKEEMHDERFSLESLPKDMHETSREHLEKLKEVLSKFCEGVESR
jgi:pyruvate formate lyase activating enzyme